MDHYVVEVGYSVRRPIVPDEGVRRVLVAARSDSEAVLVAAQMVAGSVEMVTSAVLLDWPDGTGRRQERSEAPRSAGPVRRVPQGGAHDQKRPAGR